MQYPKMLYKGNKEKYEYATANDAEHEEVLRSEDFVDYVDLVDEPEPILGKTLVGSNLNSTELDDVCEELKLTKTQLGVAITERDQYLSEVERLNQIIDAGAQENAELRAQLDALNAPTETEAEQVNYSDLTSDELRALLDEKGIKYLARDNKDTLINLLG